MTAAPVKSTGGAGFAFEDKVTTGPRAKPTMPPAVKRPTPRLALDA